MGAEAKRKHELTKYKKQNLCTCGDPDCIVVEIPRVADHYVYVDKIQKNGQLVVGKREPCFCDLRVNHWGDTT